MSPSKATEAKRTLTQTLQQWQLATWEDYAALRDDPTSDRIRLFFNQGWIWIEMGGEGINHASVNNLFNMLFAFWRMHYPDQPIHTFGGCQIEKVGKQAAAPDLILYAGKDAPRWQPGESRFINLDRTRVPNLVGEIADTTLAVDLDEMKRLYADLDVPEYWVIDVKGQRVFAFQLQPNGVYQQCEISSALPGLPIALLDRTLERLSTESNTDAALWFSQEIVNLSK